MNICFSWHCFGNLRLSMPAPKTPPKFTQDKLRPQKKQIDPKKRMIALKKIIHTFWEFHHHHHHHHHQSSSKDLIAMAINHYQCSCSQQIPSSIFLLCHHQVHHFPHEFSYLSPNCSSFFDGTDASTVSIRSALRTNANPEVFVLDEQRASVILLLWVHGGWSHDLWVVNSHD